MDQRLAAVSILVRDYDEALEFFVGKLNFDLLEDTRVSEMKRWVLVKPKGEGGAGILLAKAVGEEQERAIGNQSGGRVFLFLKTDDFDRDYRNLLEHGVSIVRGPTHEPYGTVVVFQDLYGNLWDLVGPSFGGK